MAYGVGNAMHDVFVKGYMSSAENRYYDKYAYYVYQIPGVGRMASMRDDKRYWDDYYKNTGFRPRYPGRTYQANGFGQSFAQAQETFGSLKKIYG